MTLSNASFILSLMSLDQEGFTITPNDIRDYMKRKPKEGLKELIAIKDGKIV